MVHYFGLFQTPSLSSGSSDGDNDVTVQEIPTLVDKDVFMQSMGEQEVLTQLQSPIREADDFSQQQNSIPAADAAAPSPVRQAPPPPPGAFEAIPKQRQKRVWPVTRHYNLRSRPTRDCHWQGLKRQRNTELWHLKLSFFQVVGLQCLFILPIT